MALPYEYPILRGLTAQWVYEHCKNQVEKFQNVYGKTTLKDRKLAIGFERIDPRVGATLGVPVARITFEPGIQLGNSLISGLSERIYMPGTITHEGTGAQASLSGAHNGNNRFIVEITASGEVGLGGSYSLTRTPWTGSAWGTEVVVSTGAIPASGEILVGNGQVFKLPVGENVVDGDTYTWETQAYMVSNVKGRTAVLNPRIDIYFASKQELSWDDHNVLDQLILFFLDQEIWLYPYGENYLPVQQEFLSIKMVQGRMDFPDGGPWEGTVVSLSLRFRGKNAGSQPVIFEAKIEPLIEAKIIEEQVYEREIP